MQMILFHKGDKSEGFLKKKENFIITISTNQSSLCRCDRHFPGAVTGAVANVKVGRGCKNIQG